MQSKDNTCPVNCQLSGKLTDSKPEKPQYWACYDHALSTGEADGRCAGCQALHVPADYRPSKPDQLADILLELTGFTPSRNYAVSLAYKRLKALLATEYDRGNEDGQWAAFRLLKNQPEGSLKPLIMENLERLEKLKPKGESK